MMVVTGGMKQMQLRSCAHQPYLTTLSVTKISFWFIWGFCYKLVNFYYIGPWNFIPIWLGNCITSSNIFLLFFLSFCCPSTHNLFHEKPKTSNISPPMNFVLLLWRSHQMKAISPIEKINLINYKLTKREELLFLTVLAFPKASSTGLDCRITSLIFWALFPLPETWDK